ncbi:F-box/LRR-repeat protein At2g42720-like isoform X2 [Pistacia vera]|uniref:F-box/LRR-repeat protein At2g42720-like isoform X2 n=1 Tax=Pistacia vera TaxID=55513 RepID=UPI001262C6D3|nr:F-box/LRR-repeat protein At2g42720-like isoform X2 [Pistacia vera]
MDRISLLPDSILHHILSFLSLKQVVQTSILSRRWKETCCTFPILVFDDNSHFGWEKEVLKYLEQGLLYRHMERISIRKLTISMTSFFWGRGYNLPQIVFCAESLDVLELSGCKLYSPRISVQLSLRKLYLVDVYADDQMIENLFARCPLIEYLTIDSCKGFKSLELSLSKLHEIKVSNNDELKKVEIKALNVHSVTITEIKACEIDIASCRNLKNLILSKLSIMDDWLCNVISDFSLLQYLSITNCYELKRIKISSPSLKELVIYGFVLLTKVVEVKLETPNLSIFKFRGDAISFTSNVLALSKTDLYIDCFGYDTQFFVKYIEFLGNFNQCSEVLNLQCRRGEIAIVPQELRQIFHPPLAGVKHLNLEIDGNLVDFSIPELVDGLLWLSPHVESISMSFPLVYRHKYVFEFSYKQQLTHGETPSCCQSLPISCWQNCVKAVMIEHIVESCGLPSSAFGDKVSSEDKRFVKQSYVQRFLFKDKILEMLHRHHLDLRNMYSYMFDDDDEYE